MKNFIILAFVLLLAGCAQTEVVIDEAVNPEDHGEPPTEMPQFEENLVGEVSTSNVEYFEDVEGYLAEPTQPGDYPGVIMIHEWWGLNDHIEMEARRLADNGYRVLAVDLFEGSVAENRDQALANVQGLEQDVALNNLRAAREYLSEAGSERVASLGWCFGGGQSMQLAVSDVDLDATVIYYGQVITDEDALASVDQPVLGIFGSEDSSIPVDGVQQFESNLNQLGKQNQVVIYEGVGHAFANPNNDGGYAMDEAEEAWMRTLDFLDEELKN